MSHTNDTSRSSLKSQKPRALAHPRRHHRIDRRLRTDGAARWSSRCQQTSEFANYGCAVIAGRVLDTLNAAVPNALVGPSGALDGNQFGTPYVAAGANGSFTLRVTRYHPGAEDSVSLWIRAFTVPVAPGAPNAHDSVLVRARVAPLHTVPDTASVDITLSLP